MSTASTRTTPAPSIARHGSIVGAVAAIFLFLWAPITRAQNLNWEGQTGAFVTPFAYTSPSPTNGFGLPAVAFHYLNGGSVLGNFYEVSATTGLLGRFEIGYTRALNSAGSSTDLSPLFGGGFNIFHGKAMLLPENAGKHKYLPAISVGFVARTQVRRVGGVIKGGDTSNGDFYLVATKTITQTKVPILANAGFKATDASVLGIAGNAPNWQGKAFGALGFVLPGPAKSKIAVGAEALQEPHHIQGLLGPPTPTLPTTLTYFARVIPSSEKTPFNIDFGVAQAANQITPGVELKARTQFAMGISYRF